MRRIIRNTLVDVGYTNQNLVHGVEGGRVYFDNWFGDRGGVFPGLTIVNGEEAHAVNLQNGSYGAAASADPHVIAGGTMRTTDTQLELLDYVYNEHDTVNGILPATNVNFSRKRTAQPPRNTEKTPGQEKKLTDF